MAIATTLGLYTRGIGTGLALAITYQIVVDKHHGKITCNSELNKGIEFVINLPAS